MIRYITYILEYIYILWYWYSKEDNKAGTSKSEAMKHVMIGEIVILKIFHNISILEYL